MNLLASVPDAVFFMEPYFNIAEKNKQGTPVSVNNQHIMRPKHLFDCSVAYDRMYLHEVISLFACKRTPWLVENDKEHKDCIKGKFNVAVSLESLHDAVLILFTIIPFQRAVERCANAPLMILKILKLPWLVKHLSTPNIFPSYTKFIHLVRHPGDVLKSQYASGWDDLLGVTLGENPKKKLGVDVCNEMNEIDAWVSKQDPERVLVVKYEDLIHKFEPTIRTITDYLGIPITDDLMSNFNKVRGTKFADIPRYTGRNMTSVEGHTIADRLPACRTIIDRFYPDQVRDEL